MRRRASPNVQLVFLGHGRSVSGSQGNAVHVELARDQLHPGVPPRTQAVRHPIAGSEDTREHLNVLMDRHGLAAAIPRPNELQRPAQPILPQAALFVAWWEAGLARSDPD